MNPADIRLMRVTLAIIWVMTGDIITGYLSAAEQLGPSLPGRLARRIRCSDTLSSRRHRYRVGVTYANNAQKNSLGVSGFIGVSLIR